VSATTERVIGRAFPRPDARRKTGGEAGYLSDLRIDGMLEAAIVRSPFPRARVVSIDASAALRMPGVACVLTTDDLAGVANGRAFPDSPPVQTVLTREPMFAGDAVAAVAASDRRTAQEAAAMIYVEYEELPALLSAEEALRADVQLFDQAPGNLAGPAVQLDRGDFEGALERADRVFVDEYSTQRQCAQTIEPMGCICRWQGQRLEVWTHLDNVFHLQEQLAEILGMPAASIRIRAPEALGATFGLKNGLLAGLEPVCALLSRKAGAPVRLLLTPEENMTATVTRHPAWVRLTTGVSADGRLVARGAEVLLDSGANGFGYVVVRSMLSKWATLYSTPDLRFRGSAVYTNRTPCGAYRGVGTAQIHFALESQIDEIARSLGIDPVQLRLRNVVRPGAVLPGGTPIRALGVEECIRRGAAEIGWDAARPTASGGRIRRGIGMALGMHHAGVTNIIPGIAERSECRAALTPVGGVELSVALVDKGQGAGAALTAVAAEIMGVGLELVRIEAVDSDHAPYDALGAEASRTTYVMGRAVADAARRLRDEVLARAAARSGRTVEELRLEDGGVRTADGDVVAGLAELAAGEQIGAFGSFEPGDQDPLPVIGADFCEVEVDTLTGKVRVLRLVAAQDVGRAISVLGCEGQIEGGAHHGVGYALLEELLSEDGEPLNGHFAGYRVLMAPDMPKVTPILVEHGDEEAGPFGSKGLGTGVIPAIAPAVCNAIRDAVGVRPHELPVTPARLLELLDQA
jgi:xanthine dehydrogenase molybdenum-binding subunit